ncbi:MAG: radical SAM protein [Clostridiales bacterium]|jgi:23S rRNA (adenine2503-C2)-methyltransferase|nr:radical SAM protein [Clostridiales bacterium]
MKKSLLEFDDKEMKSLMLSFGEPAFRAKQITDGLFAGKKIGEMSNVPSLLKERLGESFLDVPVEIEKKFTSADGTVKYLFRLSDGELIEGVLMSYRHGKTLCISTQIGCRMRCAFCASGLDGLKRNLTAAEMLGQVVVVNKDNLEILSNDKDGGKSHLTSFRMPKYAAAGVGAVDAFDAAGNDNSEIRPFEKSPLKKKSSQKEKGGNSRSVTNVVLMGSGEPLDNYENVVKFLRLISAPYTLNISGRNISLSTSGLSDKIEDIAKLGFQFNLTVSLHAPNDEIRSALMPINKKYNIKSVMSAAMKYFDATGRRLIFEYSMIGGVNDGRENALALCRLLKGIPCHVNLIRLNAVDETKLKAASGVAVKEFLGILQNAGISATTRRIMGADIEGACGQLRRKYGKVY